MLRIFLLLVLAAVAAAGLIAIAGVDGRVALSFGVWRIETTLPVIALAFVLIVAAGVLTWTLIRSLWRFAKT